MKFTYEQLEDYISQVNLVEEWVGSLRGEMSGAFPDNDRSPARLEIAFAHAVQLAHAAQDLANAISHLRGVAFEAELKRLRRDSECGVQVLTADFDFAMAGPGQDGKCKRAAGHDGNHDVREEARAR